MSLAKMGELFHRPFRPLRNTATCAGFQIQALTASSASWRWISRHSRPFSWPLEVDASVATRPRNLALS